MEQKAAETSSPSISLPEGGGAISGIGETFQPNLFSGTGNFNIPIFTSPGRNGFGPKLSLQYSTGSGNGVFGLGWQLSIPRITRKTEKGLPLYNDADVFVMSGAEDLIPKFKTDGTQDLNIETNTHQVNGSRITYRVSRYMPRTEGLFARIERWDELDQNQEVADSFWRITTKDNQTSLYGRTVSARITNPGQEDQVFEWLLEETFDSTGNHMLYEYACDDPKLSINSLSESNREYAQIYPRRIFYGNIHDLPTDFHGNDLKSGVTRTGTDHRDILRSQARRYLFEVVFDFGDWKHPLNNNNKFEYQTAISQEEKLGDSTFLREDPFSSFRPGFELRTMRICTHVLMIHHFDELYGAAQTPTLVKSTNLRYLKSTGTKVSLLEAATMTGYSRDNNDDYVSENLPPIEFKYSEFRPHEQRYQAITAPDNNLPTVSLADNNTQLVDLFGNGLQDIVQSTSGGIRYWRNKGNATFDRPHLLPDSPSGISFSDSGVSFGDMGGDGLADLIVNKPESGVVGFFEMQPEKVIDGQLQGGWSSQSFVHLDSQPSVNMSDPNLRMLDLTGDGLTDLLISSENEFIWYQSRGERGYSDAQRVPKLHGLEHFYFNDESGRVRLADMTGDGLNDIVLAYNGRVDYWPNLGYGHFGKRCTMSGDTRLPNDFNPKRLFLVDLDGSGTADLVYVGFNQVHFWFNQSGNSWSAKQSISGTPVTVDNASLSFSDILGTGTTSLVWSYDFGTFTDSHYKILDFCGGKKPYLLTEMKNNLGATTRVRYASSTKFYLEDQKNGLFWATPLPFPVQVVEKTENIDHISKTKLVTRFKYHHGYYDGREREFRGFGRVDQIDTEDFDVFSQSDLHESSEFTNSEKSFHVPPVEIRTWYHTGAYYEHYDIQQRYKLEYLNGVETLPISQHPIDPQVYILSDLLLELGPDSSIVEAYRTLRGSMLRQEVYAHDTSDDRNFPYSVSESSYRVQTKQDKGLNAHAVFLTTSNETLNYNYERKHVGRNLNDPKVQQQLTLQIDDYGNVVQSASISYRRRQTSHPEQDKDLVLVSTQSFCIPLASQVDFRHSMPVSDYQTELTGAIRTTTSALTSEQVLNALSNASEIPYQNQATVGEIETRKLSHQTVLYWNDDLSDSEVIGSIGFHGLTYESYQLGLTSGIRLSVYGPTLLTNNMGVEGGYRSQAGEKWAPANGSDWWIPSGIQTFDPSQYYLATETTDPFQNKTTIRYDPYHLFPVRIVDPLDNTLESIIDYRVLQPYLSRDINSNHTEVAFSALGKVVGTAVMGKAGRDSEQTLLGIDDVGIDQMRINSEADSLLGFDRNISGSNVYMTNPDGFDAKGISKFDYSGDYIRQTLHKATTRILYDLHRYEQNAQPVSVCVISREIHDKQAKDPSALQLAYSYSDGFGREIQAKAQAEPLEPNRGTTTTGPSKRRWLTSGWTVFNNKGKPIQKYEPYFTDNLSYQADGETSQLVTSTLFYDPLQRVICTFHPNHSYEKVTFDPWQQITWDANDTILLDPRSDVDVKDYVGPYITSFTGFETWFNQRISDINNPPTRLDRQQKAALNAVGYAATPTQALMGVSGGIFLTTADNKTEKLETRIALDVQNNDLSITDPRGLELFAHQFDMLSRKLRVESQDAGNKHILVGVDNQPLYHWDAGGSRVYSAYDELRRPLQTSLSRNNNDSEITEKVVYGESRPQAKLKNARGIVWKQYDGAGLATTDSVDFKGNILKSTRRLLSNALETEIKWPVDDTGFFDEVTAQGLLETSTRLQTSQYEVSFTYDSLNRIRTSTIPDGTTQFQIYNEASLLESIDIQHPNQTKERMIHNINYNAKGQRELIKYGNGVTTKYDYEPDTFRLKTISSNRRKSPKELQQLSYVYDPVGNITSIRDDAHSTIFNRNQQVGPESNYKYDALYRLIEASGREHESMTACHYQLNGKKNTEFIPLPQNTANAQAIVNYNEVYGYDKSGNIKAITHTTSSGTQIRTQYYSARSNRLNKSSAGCGNENIRIPHDSNGNITRLPHLEKMTWDYKNQLIEVDLNVAVKPNKAYYQYDTQGQRVRKTIVKNNSNELVERIYLGGYEVYTETVATNLQKQRDTIHVADDQGRIALIELDKDIVDPGKVASTLKRFQLNNHLGSASLELNEKAESISYEEYYPYGGSAFIAGRNQAETSLKRYRYSGKELDDETGMYYYGARYYTPWLARWINCDPAGKVDSQNLYMFTRGSPVTMQDVDGFNSKPPVSSSAAPMVAVLDSEDIAEQKVMDARNVANRAEEDFKNAKQNLDNASSKVNALEAERDQNRPGNGADERGTYANIKRNNEIADKDLPAAKKALDESKGEVKRSGTKLNNAKEKLGSAKKALEKLRNPGFLAKVKDKLGGSPKAGALKIGMGAAVVGALYTLGSLVSSSESKLDTVEYTDTENLSEDLAQRTRIFTTVGSEVSGIPGGQFTNVALSVFAMDSIGKQRALSAAQRNNVSDFGGRLVQMENRPYMLDRATGTLYEINMSAFELDKGALTSVDSLGRNQFGYYANEDLAAYQDDNNRWYLNKF